MRPSGCQVTGRVLAWGYESRIIISVENDNDDTDINEAVGSVMQICRQLSAQCKD